MKMSEKCLDNNNNNNSENPLTSRHSDGGKNETPVCRIVLWRKISILCATKFVLGIIRYWPRVMKRKKGSQVALNPIEFLSENTALEKFVPTLTTPCEWRQRGDWPTIVLLQTIFSPEVLYLDLWTVVLTQIVFLFDLCPMPIVLRFHRIFSTIT